MKITGETITRRQITALEFAGAISQDVADAALGSDPTIGAFTAEQTAEARARCAAAWNARHGASSMKLIDACLQTAGGELLGGATPMGGESLRVPEGTTEMVIHGVVYRLQPGIASRSGEAVFVEGWS